MAFLRFAALLTALLAVAALAPAPLSHAAPLPTIGMPGTRINGYTFSSDVSSLLSLSDTFCEIWTALLTGQNDKVLGLYHTKGGYADLVASTKGKGRTLYSILFSGVTWKVPKDINAAFNASLLTFLETQDPASLIIHALYHSRGKIMMDFLDTAMTATTTKKVRAALDGAWAMLDGNNVACMPAYVASSMSSVADREAPYNNFLYHGTPFPNLLYPRLFGDAQAAAGNRTIVRQNIMQVVQLYAEYTLTYARMNAYEADVGYGCGSSGLVAAANARTVAIWNTSKALLSGLNATLKSLDDLEHLLVKTAPGFLNLTAAIRTVISTTNIKEGDLGKPSPMLRNVLVLDTPQYNMENCTYFPPLDCPAQPQGECPKA